MPIVKTITQGGQVHIHQLRMLKQVLIAGIIVAFISALGCFVWKANNLPKHDWRMFYEVSWAKFMLATNPASSHSRLTQMYTPPIKWAPIKWAPSKIGSPSTQRYAYKRRCISVLNDPLLKKTAQRMEMILEHILYQSLKFAGLMFLAVMGLWFFMGEAHKKARHKRGNTFMLSSKLARLLKRKGEASDLILEELPLVKGKETSHLLMTGTTGSGKTNGFHTLLPQLRQRGDKAIIVDVTGAYISRYYNPETDLILNPLDMRSRNWDPWADCHLESHYDVLANAFIPENHHAKDPFWDNASKTVFKAALKKYEFLKTLDIDRLTTFLLTSSEREFEAFFKGTEAATLTCASNEKTTQSIRSVLSSHIEGLRQLETTKAGEGAPLATPPTPLTTAPLANTLASSLTNYSALPSTTPLPPSFSLRNWVMGEDTSGNPESSETPAGIKNPASWLFITARSDQRQTLKPLLSAWVDIAINALMVLPEDYNRRLWFVIDELASLQRLPSLPMGLAEGRKYGGCFLIGFQSKPQLEEIYGRQAAESMLDLFNTKVFFRCTEPSTQTWISKVLGDKEETESQTSISYGANSMRDGVSLSQHTRQKPIVMPTELSQLKDLECYIKLPGDYPCTRLQMTYKTPPNSTTPAFLLKPEKKRTYEAEPLQGDEKQPPVEEITVVPETLEEEEEMV
jgi:type IV conjugative transfer system coupling protein TraD